MTNPRMEDLERFRRLVDAYGADAKRWPAEDRRWAQPLLATSPEVQALAAEAAQLDALLDRAVLAAPTPELAAEILSAAAVEPWRRWLVSVWPFGPLWKPASALIAAALLGFVLGAATVPSGEADPAWLATEVDSLVMGPDLGMEAM